MPGRRLCSQRYRTARSTWAVEHQVQVAPARVPAPLVAQPVPLVAPALARCAAAGQQQVQVQEPAAQPAPVEEWPEALGMGCTRHQDLLAQRPTPYPSQVQRQSLWNKCWRCERDVGGQYKHSRVAAASPSSRPPSSGAAFFLAKADGDSCTESLKSGGIAFLVLLEFASARAAA